MDTAPATDPVPPVQRTSWLWLFTAAAVVGAVAGALGAAFRRALTAADDLREDLADWGDGAGLLRAVVVVAVVTTAVAVSVALVRHLAPRTAGSGIPDVERVLLHDAAAPSWRAAPVKFAAGTLSIGGGLTLGREGPTVQMGGVVGSLAGRVRRLTPDSDVLLGAGAAAGLAAAFNAPLAGALFVVEELVHRFSARLLTAAIVASATSVVVLRAWLGSALDLPAQSFDPQPSAGLIAFALLGLAAAAVGLAFNRALLRTLDALGRVPRPVAIAAIVGVAVGVVVWRSPDLTGSGYPLAQEALTGDETLAVMGGILAARVALTVTSYGIGAAGGLFAPLVVIGAELGRIAGELAHELTPGAVPQAAALTVAGMAAVLVASVRAPLTCIVLILEITGAFALILPTIVACAVAYFVPTALRDEPIYDALRSRSGPT